MNLPRMKESELRIIAEKTAARGGPTNAPATVQAVGSLDGKAVEVVSIHATGRWELRDRDGADTVAQFIALIEKEKKRGKTVRS